ncbi:MAG: acetylxylan esterase [Gemmatales bacterium]|nr:MAG: acetylxylan esterase [Gemmatales bacterium]
MSMRLTTSASALLFCLAPMLSAGGPRILPEGKLPADTRLGPLRSDRGHFPLVPAKSPEEWSQRKKIIRRLMLVTLGLWPMPSKTPLHPVIYGKRTEDDYIVEKVYLESLPSFYLTGNLYRPKNAKGKRPGVLCPHGHWPNGRFFDGGVDWVRREIVNGAERFEQGGRSPIQARCVQLARMGCVVFLYDMIGFGDSVQTPLHKAHRYSRDRIKQKEPPEKGLYSIDAENWLINMKGLHTYNSMRALDFLAGLPDVDPERLAVTGSSGGGTQTFMLCALDDRPKVAVPAVIVSAVSQGGCTCENITGLRWQSNNLEFTAMFAPKPLLLLSADDHTRDMETNGFPDLKRHYQTLGAGHNVSHAPLTQFPHNFNAVSRTRMYHWLNKHLKLGIPEPILERDYHRLNEQELSVWDKEHPRPTNGFDFELRLIEWLKADARKQIGALQPNSHANWNRFREMVGGAFDVLIGQRVPTPEQITFTTVRKTKRGRIQEELGLLRHRTHEKQTAENPCVVLAPAHPRGSVIWIDPAGKSGLFDDKGELTTEVSQLLKHGFRVLAADLYLQGEFLHDPDKPVQARWLDGEKGHPGVTYCYNQTIFARRVHDILALIALAKKLGSEEIDLLGVGRAGPLVAAAAAQAREHIHRAAYDTVGFRFASVKNPYSPNFLPGAVKYGDLPALIALAAPVKVQIAGEKHAPSLAQLAYTTLHAERNLHVLPKGNLKAAIRFLAAK